MRCCVILVLMAVSLSLPASAQNRVALVIGNDAYTDVPVLRKAVSDAEAVASTLSDQGFEVMSAVDADRRAMNRQISAFTSRLGIGDTAFLFFAGHGVEIDGENYLLPVDIVSPSAGEQDFVKAESIALSALLDRVGQTGAKVTLAVIDACRDNPFAITTGRSIGRTRGLGRIAAPEGTFVIYSAGAGQMALDELVENEAQSNSVFTRTLLPKLAEPGLELRDLVKEVRLEVRNLAKSVNHAQFPAYYDELLGEFYIAGDAPIGPRTRQRPAQQVAVARPERQEARADPTIEAGASRQPKSPPSNAAQPDISGTWTFKASCPLFIKSTGTYEIERQTAVHYKGRVLDSLGQDIKTDIFQDGFDLHVTEHTLFKTTATYRLGPSGLTATGSNSVGCDVEMKRLS